MMKKHILYRLLIFIILANVVPHSADARRLRSRKYRKQQKQHQLIRQEEALLRTSMDVFSDDDPFKTIENSEDSTPVTSALPLEGAVLRAPEKKDVRVADIDRELFGLPIELEENRPTIYEKEAQLALEKIEEATKDSKEKIEFNFENADLNNLVKQIEGLFGITFITDETLNPLAAGGKAIKGNKISFKTHKPLARKEAWNLFITFLDIAGLTVIQQSDPKVYRILQSSKALKDAVPAYIGVSHETLPDNNEIVRYVYFVANSNIEAIKSVVDGLRSPTSSFVVLQDNKAFILTDKSYNIKMLMNIVKELDKVSMPQSMSVLKLKRADAIQVKELYESLMQSPEEKRMPPSAYRTRKQPTSLYFPENMRIIAEPHTNSLVLLGTHNAIKKIEDFIIKYVDIELQQSYAPLKVYPLKYADAVTVAEIMNNITQFGQDTQAGKSGGVRGGDKYIKPMSFVPEVATNSIIIKGDHSDYLMAKDIIEKLDEEQPQVAIEILLLTISNDAAKELGTQIRSKESGAAEGFLGKNVKFQTSGLRAGGTPKGIVENASGLGVQRLLGNLINLAVGAGPANTIITLGQDALGVWGVFQALQSYTNLHVVSNPFLFATNKTKAIVALGETRRVQTSTTVTASGQEVVGESNNTAELRVEITPQINSDGMILLDIVIDNTDFTSTNPEDATKVSRKIITKTTIADREILALGGLIRNVATDNTNKTPILADIPILGWFFKNKRKQHTKQNLLALISTRIISPQDTKAVQKITADRVTEYRETLKETRVATDHRDPVHRLFFKDHKKFEEKDAADFFLRNKDVKNKKDTKKTKSRTERKAQAQEDKKTLDSLDKNKKSYKKKKNSEAYVAKSALPREIHIAENEPDTSNKSKQSSMLNNVKNKKRTPLSLANLLTDPVAEAA